MQRITKTQYNIAITSAAQNAMTLARANQLDAVDTQVFVLRAILKRQLELCGEAAEQTSVITNELDALEAMSRRLGDIVLDFHK